MFLLSYEPLHKECVVVDGITSIVECDMTKKTEHRYNQNNNVLVFGIKDVNKIKSITTLGS